MKVSDLFENFERQIQLDFQKSEIIAHSGDRGEDRERILKEFLLQHLPKKYGVTKGQVVDSKGQVSHAIDIIIYDAINCPVLYLGNTNTIPFESVYGIIEVKSKMSKHELIDCLEKIEKFKKLYRNQRSFEKKRNNLNTVEVSRPFGIAFGYDVSENSLGSLEKNYEEYKRDLDYRYSCDFVCIINHGLIYNKLLDHLSDEDIPLVSPDRAEYLMEGAREYLKENDNPPRYGYLTSREEVGKLALGRFFTYLLYILDSSVLSTPDIGKYIWPDLQIRLDILD